MIKPKHCHWFWSRCNGGRYRWAVLVQPQRVTWQSEQSERVIEVYCN